MANSEVLKALQNLARSFGSDWIGEMPVWLGNLSEEVETGTPGLYYARYASGAVITVKNSASVPPLFDLHVLVRRSRIQPNVWQITEVLEDYAVPASQGLLAHHHEQHEEGGSDRVNLDRKQIKQLSVRVSGTWEVQVEGAAVPTLTGVILIENQYLDFTSYVITAGAKYVSIETDSAGALSLHDGANFLAPSLADVSFIPVPDPGNAILAYIFFYEGQEEIADSDIRVIMPLWFIPKSSGLEIDEAPLDTPLDADLFGFWDVIDAALKAVSWSNVKATLKTYFDTLYSSIAHTHSFVGEAPLDGDLYARRSGAWEVVAGIHEHGLARWNGAIGDTTFDLPDLAVSVEWVALNGTQSDPLVYSLSSDGSQIVLDSALASADTVTASYILASL